MRGSVWPQHSHRVATRSSGLRTRRSTSRFRTADRTTGIAVMFVSLLDVPMGRTWPWCAMVLLGADRSQRSLGTRAGRSRDCGWQLRVGPSRRGSRCIGGADASARDPGARARASVAANGAGYGADETGGHHVDTRVGSGQDRHRRSAASDSVRGLPAAQGAGVGRAVRTRRGLRLGRHHRVHRRLTGCSECRMIPRHGCRVGNSSAMVSRPARQRRSTASSHTSTWGRRWSTRSRTATAPAWSAWSMLALIAGR